MDSTPPGRPDNRAPSAAAAAQMFMDLSRDYLELVPDRRTSKVFVSRPRTPDNRAVVREGTLALMMQRKFVTEGENVYISGLLERIYQEHKDELPKPLRPKLRGFRAELKPALDEIASAGIRLVSPDNTERSDQEQAELVLNGRLLHSDYPKWESAGEFAYAGLTGTFLIMQGKFRQYLKMTRLCLAELADEHKLFPLTWEEPQEDVIDKDSAARD